MNAFDYFFSGSKSLSENFILGKAEISFNELFESSLKLATYLTLNAGEGQNILLISENSIFFIIAHLGIIKSGNICIPVAPSIEQSHLDYILKSTGCKTLFIEDKIPLRVINLEINYIRNADLNILLRHPNLPENVFSESFDNNRIALILYTSGSTNRPKGVMLSHLNLTSNTESILGYLNLTPTDIMGVVLPFYYCYGLSLLHTHIRIGARLVLLKNFMYLGSVIKGLKEYKCTGFAGVPSHFQILLRQSHEFSTTDFPDLTYVTQAGGKLHDVFIKEFKAAFPQIAFYVMYGQTEGTARLAYLPSDLLEQKLGSIGREIPGVSLRILDENHYIVESGEVGEIAAKGDNIMKGYYNDPDATKEVLKDGWLLTGDLAKMDNDGYIYIVGRKKEIIKVGGKRVSPKEIEEVILSVSNVVDCNVEGIYDEMQGEAIKATIVLRDKSDEELVRKRILATCMTKLALYKVPQYICFEHAIKMNSSGKKVKAFENP